MLESAGMNRLYDGVNGTETTTTRQHGGPVISPQIALRRLVLLAIFITVPASFARSQTPTADAAKPLYESPRIAAISRELAAGNRDTLTRLWQELDGKAPLIECVGDDFRYCWVTFVWRGNIKTQKVGLLGDLPYVDRAKWYMTRLGDTNLWFKTERIPRDARFGYLINENDTGYRPDPLNPHVWAGRSVVELPDAPEEPWIREIPGVPKGTLIKGSLNSGVLKEDRTFSVYLPSSYASDGESFNLLVVFDGESYGRDGAVPTPTILDNLIYKLRIPPTMAVLVNSQKTRERDLLCSDPFALFVVKELIPWVRDKYPATSDPTRTVVAGSSYGGLAAAWIGFRHANVVGNVLSQSGTFNYNPNSVGTQDSDYYVETGWLTRQFVRGPMLPLRFYLQVGRFEGLSLPNRHLRDVLEAKGYQITFAEYSGNHDYLSWRNSLGEGLIVLFGDQRLRRVATR
jgi:enterochelin esterase-like enzyme